MISESTIQTYVRLLWSRLGGRVFRNNVGQAWMGPSERQADGTVLIHKPRRVVYGLCVGSSDLIGWRPVLITADMVGATVAQFTALEVKRPGKSPTVEQAAFLRAVIEAGGCAATVTSADDAELAFRLQ